MSDHVKEEEEQVVKTEEEKQVTKTEEEQEPMGKNKTEYNDPRTSKSFTPRLQMKLKLEDDSKKIPMKKNQKIIFLQTVIFHSLMIQVILILSRILSVQIQHLIKV